MRKAATFEQFGLSFVAGYADTLSFIAMSGLFTAHVTGNMVLAAAHVSGQGGREAVSNLVMIPVFMLAVALVALLARTSPCTGRTPAQRVRLFLALELILLTAFWWAGVSMATAKGFPLIAPAGSRKCGRRPARRLIGREHRDSLSLLPFRRPFSRYRQHDCRRTNENPLTASRKQVTESEWRKHGWPNVCSADVRVFGLRG